ncbi:MAG: mechanosensitive ion channel [Catenulispora sp.]|nr:mechanosensitive ion channel [Catenulispora sp.]
MQDRSVNSTAGAEPASLLSAAPHAGVPDLRTRAGRSLRQVLLRRGAFATAIAVAGLVVSYHYGGLLGNGKHEALHFVLAVAGAIVFLISAIIAVRCATSDILGLVHIPGRLSDARAGTLRILCLLCGYILVVLGALSLLRVPVGHLLLGGVLTGVILGIAAQQVLANVFAGIMILFARPFTIGDELRIRSGALGGPIVGRVSGMTLTYVTVSTTVGPVLVPNSAVLAAAVGPAAEWLEQ